MGSKLRPIKVKQAQPIQGAGSLLRGPVLTHIQHGWQADAAAARPQVAEHGHALILVQPVAVLAGLVLVGGGALALGQAG